MAMDVTPTGGTSQSLSSGVQLRPHLSGLAAFPCSIPDHADEIVEALSLCLSVSASPLSSEEPINSVAFDLTCLSTVN